MARRLAYAALAGATLCCALASSACEKKVSVASDPAAGATLFASACSRCHGPEGRGGLPLFDGGPSPRNFHDTAFQSERTDDQLKATIVNGKGVGMPPFGAAFNDAQLTALVAHLRKLGAEPTAK